MMDVKVTTNGMNGFDTGEAKGFLHSGEPILLRALIQNVADSDELFPFQIGDGADFLQIRVIAEHDIPQRLHDVVLGDYGVQYAVLNDKIASSLEQVLDGEDPTWRMRRVEFLSPSVLKLWFGQCFEPWHKLGGTPSLQTNAITLDFTETTTVALQIWQSLPLRFAPHRRFSYKIKPNEEFGHERIFGCWAPGWGTVLYRFYGDDGQKQTVEQYPSGVDLLIESL